MEKVTAKEFTRSFGTCRTKAHQGGIIITHHGRDDMVLISAEEYQRLLRLDNSAENENPIQSQEIYNAK